MKIAIPIWNGSVSSAFDFAHRLLLVDMVNGRETGRSEISLPPESIPERANRLKTLGAEVLICGAISRPLASLVAASGTKVLPYVVGQVDEILKAVADHRTHLQETGLWDQKERERVRADLTRMLERALLGRLIAQAGAAQLAEWVDRIVARDVDPYQAVEMILEEFAG